MTRADSAQALRMSLDSGPQGPGQATARESLPDGWGSFCSESKRASEPAHWYAVAPWDSYALREQYPHLFKDREDFRDLVATVDAPTYEALVTLVKAQTALYAAFMGEVGE